MSGEKILAEWFWTDRWIGSSAFLLPIAARGLYREMLTQAWRRGGRLPNDHEAIRRACGVTEAEWASEWPRVEQFWEVQGPWLVNETQLEIYAETVQRLGGRVKGGRKRASVAPRTGGRFVTKTGDAPAPHQLNDHQLDGSWSSIAPATHQPPSPSPDLSPDPDQGRFVKVTSTASGPKQAQSLDSGALRATAPAPHQLEHQLPTSRSTSYRPAEAPANAPADNQLDALSDRTETSTDPWNASAGSLTPASLGIRTNPANFCQVQLAHDLTELVKVRLREDPHLDPKTEARSLLADISTTTGKGSIIDSLDLSRISTEWASVSSHAARKLAAEVYGVELDGRERLPA